MERERACDTLQNLRGGDLFSEPRVRFLYFLCEARQRRKTINVFLKLAKLLSSELWLYFPRCCRRREMRLIGGAALYAWSN